MKTERQYGDYTATVSRDNRGRVVAELYHTQSGKTIGITEVDTIQDGWWWAKKLADTFQED